MNKNIKLGASLLVAAFGGFLCLRSCLFYVTPDHRVVLFNKVSGIKPHTYGEGFHLKLPLVEVPPL